MSHHDTEELSPIQLLSVLHHELSRTYATIAEYQRRLEQDEERRQREHFAQFSKSTEEQLADAKRKVKELKADIRRRDIARKVREAQKGES